MKKIIFTLVLLLFIQVSFAGIYNNPIENMWEEYGNIIIRMCLAIVVFAPFVAVARAVREKKKELVAPAYIMGFVLAVSMFYLLSDEYVGVIGEWFSKYGAYAALVLFILGFVSVIINRFSKS